MGDQGPLADRRLLSLTGWGRDVEATLRAMTDDLDFREEERALEPASGSEALERRLRGRMAGSRPPPPSTGPPR
jgi:hypothetical protein